MPRLQLRILYLKPVAVQSVKLFKYQNRTNNLLHYEIIKFKSISTGRNLNPICRLSDRSGWWVSPVNIAKRLNNLAAIHNLARKSRGGGARRPDATLAHHVCHIFTVQARYELDYNLYGTPASSTHVFGDAANRYLRRIANLNFQAIRLGAWANSNKFLLSHH